MEGAAGGEENKLDIFSSVSGERRDAFTLDTLETPSGAGSGLVWDATHVVTNYHVVRGADDLRVTLSSGAELAAKLVGQDADRDIAVLELGDVVADGPVFGAGVDGAGVDGGVAAPAPTLPKPRPRLVPIVRGSSASLQVGQRVLCIGNPFGLDHTLTTGVLSGTGREIPSGVTGRPIQGALQASCALNPGNSGGAMLDSAGRVIGAGRGRGEEGARARARGRHPAAQPFPPPLPPPQASTPRSTRHPARPPASALPCRSTPLRRRPPKSSRAGAWCGPCSASR